MNRKLTTAAIAIVLFGSQAFAETDPAKQIDQQWAERAKVQQQMATHMQMMRATMAKIRAADDADVRKQLMDDHMQEMRAMFGMMEGMPSGMANGGKMGGHMQGIDTAEAAYITRCNDDTEQCRQMNAMARRHAYLEREVAMMQMMMQQMMERGVALEQTESRGHN